MSHSCSWACSQECICDNSKHGLGVDEWQTCVNRATRRLTIPRIRLEYLLRYREFLVPVCLSPFHGRRPIAFRTIWDILEAPSTVIPYPVDFWICLQSSMGHGELIRQNIIDFLRSTTKAINPRTFLVMFLFAHLRGNIPLSRIFRR